MSLIFPAVVPLSHSRLIDLGPLWDFIRLSRDSSRYPGIFFLVCLLFSFIFGFRDVLYVPFDPTKGWLS